LHFIVNETVHKEITAYRARNVGQTPTEVERGSRQLQLFIYLFFFFLSVWNETGGGKMRVQLSNHI
jgi:hypothetical protein